MEKTEPWHNKETKTLIDIWSEDEVQRELEGTVRNQKVFQKISQRMWELGYNRSPDRCRVKIKKLKQDYRRLKEYNKRNGTNRKTNQWYTALDAVLGRRAENAGRTVSAESSTSLLDSVMNCNGVEDGGDTDDDVLSGKFKKKKKKGYSVRLCLEMSRHVTTSVYSCVLLTSLTSQL